MNDLSRKVWSVVRDKRMLGLYVVVAVLIVVALVLVPKLRAEGDTETSCGVTHAEFDNMAAGRTVTEVANRFDVYGIYLDDNPSTFRRAYRTCWAPGERRVIVEFSYNTGGSVDWYVRDVPQ